MRTLIALVMLTTVANAGGFKIEKPCWNHCGPQATYAENPFGNGNWPPRTAQINAGQLLAQPSSNGNQTTRTTTIQTYTQTRWY